MLTLFDRFIAENTADGKGFRVRSGMTPNIVGKLEEEINRKRKATNLEVTIKKMRRTCLNSLFRFSADILSNSYIPIKINSW